MAKAVRQLTIAEDHIIKGAALLAAPLLHSHFMCVY